METSTKACSRCGQNYGMPQGIFSFCPNCGAEMEEVTPEDFLY